MKTSELVAINELLNNVDSGAKNAKE